MIDAVASPRVSLRSDRRLGWRILLGAIGLAGGLNFSRGLGEMVTLWSGRELWYYVWFSVPYIVLLLAFTVGLAALVKGHTRIAAILVLSALVVSVGLFAYDVTYQRIQFRVGVVGEDGQVSYHGYFVFWWWWEKWGEICVT